MFISEFMSYGTQIEFAGLIGRYFQQHQIALKLTCPSFEKEGFINSARMCGTGGVIEIICGPAEYNAEIFINTLKDHKRWSLADLMSIPSVRNWLIQNRTIKPEKSRLEAEIERAFCLLVDGLKGVPNFDWIYEAP